LFKSAHPSNSDYWQEKLSQGIDVLYSRTINGYKAMPAKGGCVECTNLEVIAAVKYLLQISLPDFDFRLW
jgi:cytochrome c5